MKLTKVKRHRLGRQLRYDGGQQVNIVLLNFLKLSQLVEVIFLGIENDQKDKIIGSTVGSEK